MNTPPVLVRLDDHQGTLRSGKILYNGDTFSSVTEFVKRVLGRDIGGKDTAKVKYIIGKEEISHTKLPASPSRGVERLLEIESQVRDMVARRLPFTNQTPLTILQDEDHIDGVEDLPLPTANNETEMNRLREENDALKEQIRELRSTLLSITRLIRNLNLGEDDVAPQ